MPASMCVHPTSPNLAIKADFQSVLRTLESLFMFFVLHHADLPTPITWKSGGFEKEAQKNLEIRTSNLETSKIYVK